MTAEPGRKTQDEFSLTFVVQTLLQQSLLTLVQAKEIIAREAMLRARVLHAVGSDTDKYQVSPVELVAAHKVPIEGRAGELLDQDRISAGIAERCGVPYVKIDPMRLDMPLITRTLSRPFAARHVLLALSSQGDVLNLAVANPFDHDLFEQVSRLTGKKIRPYLTAKQDILHAISDTYGFKSTVARAVDEAVSDPGMSNFEQLVVLSADKELQAEDKPVINACEYLLRYAFDQRASDIHLEPKRDHTVMRLRIDGVLHPAFTLPRAVHAPIAARFKMLARMDISEKRRPQDGRIKTQKDQTEIELRVSTLPTAFGEKMVLRIFDPDKMTTLDQLGFEAHERKLFENWIGHPHGLILVTGPTGSGKTTTLYSALRSLAGPDVNVTTIEDPIEMVYDGFNQVQVQPKLDLDFASALRHILRQDPDIIMVGEIRDHETASNAIQCALTGHLVLSTLHTNDSVGAVARMRDLGVPSFLLGSSLLGVMAQRLVRVNCPACAEPVELSADQLGALSVPLPLLPEGLQLRAGKGCVKCRQTGFRGRSGVFEMFHVDRELRQLISAGAEGNVIEASARQRGMRLLREAAVHKLARGVTTFDEVLRMTADQ
jgi:general secretion pathway protein E